MSHYNKLKTELKNKESLLKALAKMGFGKEKVEVHETATPLFGFQGDKRDQKGNIVIRRKYVGGAANDIGFELEKDGTYHAHISDYDRHRYNDKWMTELETHYGVEQAKQAFSNEGWSFTESVDEENNIQLVGTRFGGF